MSSAVTSTKPSQIGEKRNQSDVRSTPFVFFGATGDLAHKKFFQPLQGDVKAAAHLGCAGHRAWRGTRWHARAAPRPCQLQPRKPGGLDPAAFGKLPVCCATSTRLRGAPDDVPGIAKSWARARRPAHYAGIPRCCSTIVSSSQGVAQTAPAIVRSRSSRRHFRAGAQPDPAGSLPTRRRFSGSTTISASGRCTTCLSFDSPTPSWSPSGTALTARACRSPWPVRHFGARAGGLLRRDRRRPRRAFRIISFSRPEPIWRWTAGRTDSEAS